jgi:hypothetical protein
MNMLVTPLVSDNWVRGEVQYLLTTPVHRFIVIEDRVAGETRINAKDVSSEVHEIMSL